MDEMNKTTEPKAVGYFQKALRDLLAFCDAYPHTVLYGAGVIGNFVAEVLKKYNKKIEAMIVSDGQPAPKRGDGIPVFALSQLPFAPGQCGVVVTSSIRNHKAILKATQEVGLVHLFPPGQTDAGMIPDYEKTLVFLYMMDRLVYGDLKKTDFTDPVWDFAGCRLPNAYYWVDLTWEPVAELQDFVLPALGYKDIPSGMEGPYEYGPVRLQKGDIVLDCGAHMGYFSAVAAFRGCTAYAFEPSPGNRFLLQKTRDFYPGSIEIVPYAVAEKKGTVCFREEGVNIGNGIVPPGFTEHSIEVQAVPLDAYIKENHISRVDFIKADIEGAERQMLRGAQGILKEFAPKLAICTYHLPDDRQVLRDLILQANPDYQIHQGHSKLYAYVPD